MDYPVDPMFRVRTERGRAREEYYVPQFKEEFGINKRTRRLKHGIPVTLPDGSWPKEQL